MDLSRIDIKPRIRNIWESIDLGFVMATTWFRPLFLSWFIPAAVVYALLSIVFFENNWIAICIVWWLKPLWDRAPLYIASRYLFNDQITASEIIRILPRLYFNDAIAWLTWRRLSITRSFDMPVTILESLKHSARSARLGTLHQNTSSAATWLTIVCVHLEMVITFGIVAFVMILIPDEVDISVMSFLVDEDVISTFAYNTVTLFAMALVAPFYTMSGFSLYINRRIKLEAWDIEIRFRHIAEKHAHKKTLNPVLPAILLSICFVSMWYPHHSYAEDQPSAMQEKSSIVIKEVLQGPDFHNEVVEQGWRLKDFDDTEEDEGVPSWLISFIRFLEGLFGDIDTDDDKNQPGFGFANFIEVLLWICAILLVVYATYRLNKHYNLLGVLRNKKSLVTDEAPPDILFGLDVRKDSIPDDMVSQTLKLWSMGKHREAIGMLYRSTLSLLIHQFSYRFYDGHTEQECADIVSRTGDRQLKQFVISITQLWQQIAYAHAIPSGQDVQTLCEKWPGISRPEVSRPGIGRHGMSQNEK